MNLQQAVAKRISDYCGDKKKLTVNGLCSVCGITQSTINNILHGQSKNPTVSTIKKICDGLEISLSEFFDSPYFDCLQQEVK